MKNVCDFDEKFSWGKTVEIRISVRNLVEFLMRGGDLDNRHAAQADQAMQAGGRVHREIQKNMGPEYSAEVPLRITEQFDDYALFHPLYEH